MEVVGGHVVEFVYTQAVHDEEACVDGESEGGLYNEI